MQDLNKILAEVTKVKEYKWGVFRQNNKSDNATNFIYDIKTYDELVAKCAELPEKLANYAVVRWYNLKCHDAVASLLLKKRKITGESNPKHKHIDLYIDKVPFDLKLTVMPKKLIGKKVKPIDIVRWLYDNQSKGRRWHRKNRLFVVVLDTNENELSWQIKRNFKLIKRKIDEWCKSPKYYKIDKTFTAVIMVEK